MDVNVYNEHKLRHIQISVLLKYWVKSLNVDRDRSVLIHQRLLRKNTDATIQNGSDGRKRELW